MRATFLMLILTAALAGIAMCADPAPSAVLWQKPGSITLRDWVWGPGGEARAPQPPFEFIGEDLKGTNPKIKVRDAKGDQWTVKFGGENHSDVFAARLLHATGYVSAPSYFVASGVISGAHDLKRAKPFLHKDGRFAFARFKLSDHQMLARVDGRDWSWTENPFTGTHELNGLKILLMLTSNWDAKDARDGKGSNTAVYSGPGASAHQLYYAFDDWGATMGKWGGFFKRDKWDADGYRAETRHFVRGADGQTIRWGYRGKHNKDVVSNITVADVGWLLGSLSAVTDEDLRAGLRASGATPAQVDSFAKSMRDRIGQLQRLVTPQTASR